MPMVPRASSFTRATAIWALFAPVHAPLTEGLEGLRLGKREGISKGVLEGVALWIRQAGLNACLMASSPVGVMESDSCVILARVSPVSGTVIDVVVGAVLGLFAASGDAKKRK